MLDSGYFSDANVGHCEAANITSSMATGRDGHHQRWAERFTEPAPLAPEATPTQTMRHRLATKVGRARYALRKQTVEPVFGIIKSVLGFRQFLMRGLDTVQIEWTLVCLAWNLKRMVVLGPQHGETEAFVRFVAKKNPDTRPVYDLRHRAAGVSPTGC